MNVARPTTRNLAGAVALVTGGATGIGRGIARALAESGAVVVIAGRRPDRLSATAAQLAADGHDVRTVTLDVTDRDAWASAVARIERDLGHVRILVNNAGVSTLGLAFDEITPDIWDAVIATNLTGVYNGIRACIAGMRAAGGGQIVNVSSMGGVLGIPRLSPYCASKFAVVGLSESLRAELAPDGVGVTTVCPGGVRSELWRTSRALRGLPDTEVPPDDGSAQSAVAAMDPAEVGADVVHAILHDEAYVFTHPHYRERLEARAAGMLDALDRSAARHPQRREPA